MSGLIVTIGSFDGVHLGHEALIKCLCDKALSLSLKPAIVTFAQHPRSVVAPGDTPLLLTTDHEKEALLTRDNLRLIVLDFNEQLRRTTALEFLRTLRDHYGVKAIVTGFNNHFGCDRVCGGQALDAICAELGISAFTCGETIVGTTRVSSSAIRSLIDKGEMAQAVVLLGHPYTLTGTVGHGKAIGRTIGFPTANLTDICPNKLLPPAGVYAATVDIPGEGRHAAMLNIGQRPTVDTPDAPVTIEAHIIDYHGDLYNQRLTLAILARIRDEHRFASLAQLTAQLTRDRLTTLRLTTPPSPIAPPRP